MTTRNFAITLDGIHLQGLTYKSFYTALQGAMRQILSLSHNGYRYFPDGCSLTIVHRTSEARCAKITWTPGPHGPTVTIEAYRRLLDCPPVGVWLAKVKPQRVRSIRLRNTSATVH